MSETMNPTAAYKETAREEWTGAAAFWKKWYPKFSEQSRAATELVVSGAQLQSGMTVLDMASGSGQPSLTIAAKVGPQGHVIATDMVPEMLQVARENAAKAGVTNIEFRLSEAEHLPFKDAEFDRVTCRFGLMLFADSEEALAQVRRVLRPGGRVSFLTWGSFEENPYFTLRLKPFFKYVDVPRPEPDAPGIFKFSDPAKLASALAAAGFRDVHADKHIIPFPWVGSVEECFEASRELAAPSKKIMAALPADKTEEVMKEVLAGMRKFDDGKRLNFEATVVLGTAAV